MYTKYGEQGIVIHKYVNIFICVKNLNELLMIIELPLELL